MSWPQIGVLSEVWKNFKTKQMKRPWLQRKIWNGKDLYKKLCWSRYSNMSPFSYTNTSIICKKIHACFLAYHKIYPEKTPLPWSIWSRCHLPSVGTICLWVLKLRRSLRGILGILIFVVRMKTRIQMVEQMVNQDSNGCQISLLVGKQYLFVQWCRFSESTPRCIYHD